jgi:hypothetical protein
MENRSTRGACIRIKTRIGVGWKLSIQSHREQFSGVARHCREDGKDFLVGILKDEAYRPVMKPPPAEVVPGRKAARAGERLAPRERVSMRGERRATNVSSGNGARIETPIAERLMVKEATQRERPRRAEVAASVESPPSAPSPPPARTAAAPEPVKESLQGKSARKEWRFMKLKWFGNEEELLAANGNGTPANESPAPKTTEPAPRVERRAPAAAAAESEAGVQGELLAMEDIYRAAGITSPRRGYSITKVVEMLRSEHMRGLSKEMRRAALLMALDAAGVSVDEVLQDAKVRQEAIEAYATEQRKHAETQWARKAEENLQIQAELEQVKALYAEKIRRNLDGIAREKATFGNWLKLKEQETQGMTEAVEQVLKAPAAAEAAGDPLLSVPAVNANGKPV